MRATVKNIASEMEKMFEKHGEDLANRFYPLYSNFNDIWEPKNEKDVYDTIKHLVDSFIAGVQKGRDPNCLIRDYDSSTGCIVVGFRNDYDGNSPEIYIEFQHGAYKYL